MWCALRRVNRDGDPNAGPSGANLSDLQGSYTMQLPFSPNGAGQPGPASQQGPSRYMSRWQDSPQRTSHTPNLGFPWSPLNFGCETLSPGCPALSTHPMDFPPAQSEQPQEGARQGSPDKRQQGPENAMAWAPTDIRTVHQTPGADAVAVEILDRQDSRSHPAEPEHSHSGLSTVRISGSCSSRGAGQPASSAVPLCNGGDDDLDDGFDEDDDDGGDRIKIVKN
jgi:hypothetical protein